MEYFSHSRNEQGGRHGLVEHLVGVASLAEQFAAELGAAEAGRYLGLWHDVGKFDPAWQRYLLDAEAGSIQPPGSVDHKAAGAQLAQEHSALLALLIQGHHGGLRTRTDLATWLDERLAGPAVAAAITTAR